MKKSDIFKKTNKAYFNLDGQNFSVTLLDKCKVDYYNKKIKVLFNIKFEENFANFSIEPLKKVASKSSCDEDKNCSISRVLDGKHWFFGDFGKQFEYIFKHEALTERPGNIALFLAVKFFNYETNRYDDTRWYHIFNNLQDDVLEDNDLQLQHEFMIDTDNISDESNVKVKVDVRFFYVDQYYEKNHHLFSYGLDLHRKAYASAEELSEEIGVTLKDKEDNDDSEYFEEQTDNDENEDEYESDDEDIDDDDDDDEYDEEDEDEYDDDDE